MQANLTATSTATKIALGLTFMAAGRAMTVAWIPAAGDGGLGDPPAAWLMPLIGDAVVGLAAIAIGVLLLVRRTPGAWAAALAWTSVAAFDALAAYIVDIQTPWPSFFMLEVFGRAMFFAAAGMHLVILGLLISDPARRDFGVAKTS